MSKELMVTNELETLPDYLKGVANNDTMGLGQEDFKIPLIKLLQPLSPEVSSGTPGAKAGEFWHTGAKRSLGAGFDFIPAHIGKKVILYEPTKSGTGGRILAYSRDAIRWDTGANSSFTVNVKGASSPIVWKTGKDVHSSGLLGWGSSNPDDEKSPPAAMKIFYYMCVVVDSNNHKRALNDLTPVLFGLYKTALPAAQDFNTQLLVLRGPEQKIAPPPSVVVHSSVKKNNKDGTFWFTPVLTPVGRSSEERYKDALMLGKQYASYNADFTEIVHEDAPTIEDTIKF